MKGDSGGMISQRISYQVRKCNKTIDNILGDHHEVDCREDPDIEEYIKDLSIEQWLIHDKIDFEKYFEKPIHCSMELIG